MLELWLFDTAPASDNDNAAFTPSDSELAGVLAVIPLPYTYVGDATSGAGGNCIYTSGDISKQYKCASGTTSIFGVLVVRNAYVPVTDETFNIIISTLQA